MNDELQDMIDHLIECESDESVDSKYMESLRKSIIEKI